MGDVYEWADRMEMGMLDRNDRQGNAVVHRYPAPAREMTELEAFQQEELRIMANELARSGKCVKGGSILCDDRHYSCQECWLAWVRGEAKRHLKGGRHD